MHLRAALRCWKRMANYLWQARPTTTAALRNGFMMLLGERIWFLQTLECHWPFCAWCSPAPAVHKLPQVSTHDMGFQNCVFHLDDPGKFKWPFGCQQMQPTCWLIMWFWWLRFSAICNRRGALIWTIVEFFILVEIMTWDPLLWAYPQAWSEQAELPQLSAPLWLPQEWYHAVLWDHGAKPSIYATGMQLNAYFWHLMHGTAHLCVHVIIYL